MEGEEEEEKAEEEVVVKEKGKGVKRVIYISFTVTITVMKFP